MAGTIFGDVGASLVVASAAFGEILGDSRARNVVFFPYKTRLKVRF